ncbi:MAG: hypothetical protein QXF75_00145 [Candidatus Bathyarchaeia archaeon]
MSMEYGFNLKKLKEKIKALHVKAAEFKAQGDLTRAENCLFLARYLEDFIKELQQG